MATAKSPGTTKKPLADTPVEEAVEAVVEAPEEPTVEEIVEEPVEAPVAPLEAVTEEPVVQEVPAAKTPFVGDQRTWHGAQTGQRYNARIQ